MRVRVPGYLIAGAAWVLLGPAAGAGAAQSPSGSIDPAAAARACPTPRAHAEPPAKPTVATLTALANCVLRAEREQLGLSYRHSAALSRLLDAALSQFIALPYLAQHHPQLVQPAEQSAGDRIVKSFCQSAGPGVSRGGWEFANRDAVSPLQLAQDLAKSFRAADATARAAGAQFGVAARPGLLFRGGYRRGVSLGVIAVTCS
jgi:hypothetical protein